MKNIYRFCYSDLLPAAAGQRPMDLYSPCDTEAEGQATMRQAAKEFGGHYARLTIDLDSDIDPQIVVYCATRRPWHDDEVTEALCTEIDKGIMERLYKTGAIPLNRTIPGCEYSIDFD